MNFKISPLAEGGISSTFFFFNDTATPEFSPLPLHAALPIYERHDDVDPRGGALLALDPPRPHDVIVLGQLHGGVDLLHRLRDHAAHVAQAMKKVDAAVKQIGRAHV